MALIVPFLTAFCFLLGSTVTIVAYIVPHQDPVRRRNRLRLGVTAFAASMFLLFFFKGVQHDLLEGFAGAVLLLPAALVYGLRGELFDLDAGEDDTAPPIGRKV